MTLSKWTVKKLLIFNSKAADVQREGHQRPLKEQEKLANQAGNRTNYKCNLKNISNEHNNVHEQ